MTLLYTPENFVYGELMISKLLEGRTAVTEMKPYSAKADGVAHARQPQPPRRLCSTFRPELQCLANKRQAPACLFVSARAQQLFPVISECRGPMTRWIAGWRLGTTRLTRTRQLWVRSDLPRFGADDWLVQCVQGSKSFRFPTFQLSHSCIQASGSTALRHRPSSFGFGSSVFEMRMSQLCFSASPLGPTSSCSSARRRDSLQAWQCVRQHCQGGA